MMKLKSISIPLLVLVLHVGYLQASPVITIHLLPYKSNLNIDTTRESENIGKMGTPKQQAGKGQTDNSNQLSEYGFKNL